MSPWRAENPKPRKSAKSVKYVGTLRNVRIHNRALGEKKSKIHHSPNDTPIPHDLCP